MKYRLLLIGLVAVLAASCGGPSVDSPKKSGKAVPGEVRTATGGRPESRPTTASDASEPDRPGRKWTDSAGKVVAIGDLITLLDGDVCLQSPSGEGIVVPLENLCQADQNFVRRETGGDSVEVPEALGKQPGDPVDRAAKMTEASASDNRPSDRSLDLPTQRTQKVVVPFDFVSEFDNGRYGRMVGQMVWKKLEREGEFLIPESMLDIRDICTAGGIKITPDTPLESVEQVVRRDFDADVAIWGRVERTPGHEWEVYDLTVKCVDFTVSLEPRVIYEKTGVRTNSVSEIPHLYIKEMLDALYGREPGGPEPVDPAAEENWKNNPNLVQGGDFQTGADGVPNGWESRGGQERESLGGLVRWMPEEGGDADNKVIRFTFDESVGNGFGVMYYSRPFPIEAEAKYRFQCRYRSNGPKIIVFIKCYDRMESVYKKARTDQPSPGGKRSDEDSLTEAAASENESGAGEPRECYRSQQNLKGPKNVWNLHTQDFTPRHTKYAPKSGRVMLYAYLGAGVVEFDDVVLKQIVPAVPGESKKVPRHSMESGVTIEQMRQNEERGRQAREKLKEDK
jgi:SLA1 Homology Domain 1 (SHD1) protein